MIAEASIVVGAPPAQVWRAIVDASERAGWWSYLTLDAVPGGRFEERWTGDSGTPMVTAGHVVELDAGRLLRLSWADEGWTATTEVTITLQPDGAGSTAVHVVHAGWDRLSSGAELAEAHAAGWQAHLEHLAAHVRSRPSPQV